MRPIQIRLVILLVAIVKVSFSQVGTYTLGTLPPEAFNLISDENGGPFIPPLFVGTSTIELKSNKEAIIVHNENESDELEEVGTWTESEKDNTVLINIQYETETVTLEFEIVTFESGTYLKVSQFMYYKKIG